MRLFIDVFMAILIAVVMTVPSNIHYTVLQSTTPIHVKAGDWITYTVSPVKEPSCIFKMRIEVLDVNGSIIKYRRVIEELNKDKLICSGYVDSLDILLPSAIVKENIRAAELEPYKLKIFVDPNYSGRYKEVIYEVEYEKGVLRYFEGYLRAPADLICVELRLRIELEETNITWLKPSSWDLRVLLIPLFIAIVMSAVIMFVAKGKKV